MLLTMRRPSPCQPSNEAVAADEFVDILQVQRLLLDGASSTSPPPQQANPQDSQATETSSQEPSQAATPPPGPGRALQRQFGVIEVNGRGVVQAQTTSPCCYNVHSQPVAVEDLFALWLNSASATGTHAGILPRGPRVGLSSGTFSLTTCLVFSMCVKSQNVLFFPPV